jgi:hypothetical protein
MIKNIKVLVLLMVAAVAMFAVSCNKPEPEPEPQIMNIVGTSWKFYFNKLVENTGTELDGIEITLLEEVQVLSADSLHRLSSVMMNGYPAGSSDFNASYTWDGSTLVFTNKSGTDTLKMHYREGEDVFYRELDMSDPQAAQLSAMLGLSELVYIRQ